MSSDDDTSYTDVLANVIAEATGAQGVEFDEDGEHVYVAVGGEKYTRRYRLSQNCQHFLAGEFPLDQIDALSSLTLEAPDDADR